MMRYVLDTNIVSFILKFDLEPLARLNQVSAQGHHVLGCPVVWYEIRRGLLASDAKRQMQYFERLFQAFIWDDYNREDWVLAATWWAQRRAQGRPIDNADLLIAVFARSREAVLVTDNEKDFAGLGLTLENWTR